MPLSREVLTQRLVKHGQNTELWAKRAGTSAVDRRWAAEVIAAIAGLTAGVKNDAGPTADLPAHFWRDPETGFVIETQISAGRPAKTVQATDFPICITRGERE